MFVSEAVIDGQFVRFCAAAVAAGSGEKEAEALAVRRIVEENRSETAFILGELGKMGYPVEGLFPDGKSFASAYTYRAGSLRDGESFIVSGADLAGCIPDEDKLRRGLRSGRFFYVDGHVLINSPKFLSFSEGAPVITDYALSHMDECALKFRYDEVPADATPRPYLDRTAGDYRKVIRRCRYVCVPDEDSMSYYRDPDCLDEVEDGLAELGRELETLSEVETLRFMVKDVMMCNYGAVEVDVGIGDGLLSRFLSGDRRPSKKTVVAICLYLRFPPEITFKILENEGFALAANNRNDRAYRFLVETMWSWGDIKAINAVLRARGLEPLTRA